MRKKIKKYVIPHKGNEYKPHLLREFSVIILLAITVGVLGLSFLATKFVRSSSLLSAVYPAVLADLANQDRIANNQNALSVSPLLTKAADLKALDMVQKGYFAHVSPDGTTPWYWFEKAGYDFIYAGENLAINFSESADVNTAWLNSPEHRANILNVHFTQIGVAVERGIYQGQSTQFVVQMFGSPASDSAKAPSKKIVVVAESTTTNQSLIVAQNLSALTGTVAGASTSVALPTSAPAKYSTPFERLALNPSEIALYIFYVLAALIGLTLILMIFINIRLQHPRNVVYGLVLLLVIAGAVYLNQGLLLHISIF